jgi:CheY-like chemotaxis protein
MASVVVIDHCAESCNLAVASLEQAGFQVFSAGDGKVGLELMRQIRPAVVALEILLPGLHGFALCQEVRNDPALRRTRVIVTSSKSYPTDIKKALELGAVAYLTKPVTGEELVSAVRTAIERKPVPPNETARLAALRRFRILDTTPEKGLDDLTLLASTICETPVAMISLVDSDRQWFKSKIGTDLAQTSRDIAFCAHGILQPDIFEVPDATADQRFRTNVLVTLEPKVRFYAGAPLLTAEGEALGMLCVIDHVARRLSDFQRKCLGLLSRLAMAQLELRRQVLQLAG